MNQYKLFVILVLLTTIQLYSQGEKYPTEDFYHRNIELPIDYDDVSKETFSLCYQLPSNFDFKRPTLFIFYDSQQQDGEPGKVDDLARRYGFFDDFNVVWYQHRGRKYSYIELKNADSTVNWEKAYITLSSKQVVEDIERVRRDLFKDHPDEKIMIYGRSGGAYLIQEYLAKYSDHVKRALISVTPNPIIMQQIGHLESTYLYETLTAIDSSLYKKLEAVLKSDVVPYYNLLWMLKQIPYTSQNPQDELSKLINELSDGKKELYENYLQRRGFDFSKLLPREKMMGVWEIGMVLRPLECDTEYMLGPEPRYIDPLYLCLRKGCENYISLIESKKVAAPVNPPLESFSEVKSEIFCLMAKSDHVSPYQIGIELGKYFKNYELFIADDNHGLTTYKECYPKLMMAFFKYGSKSKELEAVKDLVTCKEWKPE